MKSNFWKIWGIPIILAIISMIGLITALVGDGVWDAVSWLGLGVPLAIAGWYLFKKPQVAKK